MWTGQNHWQSEDSNGIFYVIDGITGFSTKPKTSSFRTKLSTTEPPSVRASNPQLLNFLTLFLPIMTQCNLSRWWMGGVRINDKGDDCEYGDDLTLSQTKNSRFFQTERICIPFQIKSKWQNVFPMGRKQCGKRRNCSLPATSPFPTLFSKKLYCKNVKKKQGLFSKGITKMKRMVAVGGGTTVINSLTSKIHYSPKCPKCFLGIKEVDLIHYKKLSRNKLTYVANTLNIENENMSESSTWKVCKLTEVFAIEEE